MQKAVQKAVIVSAWSDEDEEAVDFTVAMSVDWGCAGGTVVASPFGNDASRFFKPVAFDLDELISALEILAEAKPLSSGDQ